MKKIISLTVLTLSSVFCFAQGTKSTTPPPAQNAAPVDSTPYHAKLYQNAMLFQDYMVAKEAMFNLITLNPTRIDYLDSLARLYYAVGGMQQSLLASKIVLEKQPDNLPMMELSAICYDALGSKKEALETYENLYKQSKSIQHLYQISVLQFSLQRWGECGATCDAILKNPEAKDKKVNIAYDQNNSQEVPISAAIHNLRGVMYKEMKEDAKAKPEFEEALKEFPEFALAKSNLEIMNAPPETEKEKEKSGKKK
nr:hypothetical protein [Bacteroidota bacterium]